MKPRILWIDDEWQDQPEQVAALRKVASEVDCATSVAEGLEKLRSNEYEGILVDMILPWSRVGDDVPVALAKKPFLGMEVVTEVAKRSEESRPRVVVFTIARDDRLLGKLNSWKKQGVIAAVIGKIDPDIVGFDAVAQKCVAAMGVG